MSGWQCCWALEALGSVGRVAQGWKKRPPPPASKFASAIVTVFMCSSTKAAPVLCRGGPQGGVGMSVVYL